MKKRIFVLPHRIGESDGTNKLLLEKKAEAIYDIDNFISIFSQDNSQTIQRDEFLEYCKTNPFYNEAVLKFGGKLFEYELNGKIVIKNGVVFIT